MKLPAFQFYPGDWRKDPNLCRCSHAAKGVWIDMICLMHETEERGVLSTNGIPWTEDDIVLAVGGDSSVIRAAIQELTLKGVVNRGVDGAVMRLHPMSSDSKIGMYVSACRRNYIKSQSSGGDQS